MGVVLIFNAVDFEVPSDFKELNVKNGSAVKYNGHGHLLSIHKIENDEDYHFYFESSDGYDISKTDRSNIYKSVIIENFASQLILLRW